MIDRSNIKKGMEVRDSAGHHFGTVDDVESDGLKLTRKDSPDGRHHHVLFSAIDRVDSHVHLKPVTGAGATTATGAVAARSGGGIGRILPWLLLALGALVLLIWLSGSFDGKDDGARGITDTGAFSENANSAAVDTGTVGTETAAATPAGVGTLGTYLGGTEPAPRTFTFDTLNFDTGKSTVRGADKAELNAVAATLKQYGNSRVRVVGYADARGAEPANAALGKARADAVKAALVASGIDGGRIETESGGETDPVGANETAGGRAENRRTELVVTSR